MIFLFMTFKERLKDEIEFKGYTYKELGTFANINPRALQNYLGVQSSVPPADTAVRIAEALGVSVEYLITGETQAEKEIPNYVRYKKLLTRLENLSSAEYENVEPFLLAAIKAEQERRSTKAAKTG